eukprot:GFKZ01013606.1.p1 GENE.GFKZ01013606.1~~GFKZ01013606.1.p1  ORF type:complete len:230 (+),score=29.27 GFKZ01013606.1:241-930(+)
MAVSDRNRFVRIYHSLVAIIMLLAGGALVGLGIWLLVTDNGGPINLEYSGDNFFRVVLNFGIGSIIIGAFLLFTAIAGIFAMARKSLGVTFRIIYVLAALIIFAALVFICVISILILRNDDSPTVKQFVLDAWQRTIQDEARENDVCEIEQFYECRGFEDNDCVSCPLGTEAACQSLLNCANCGVPSDPAVGCYGRILDSIRDVYLPTAIVSGILALVVLVDIFVACAL